MLTIKPQQERSPIIVDDSYDLEETVALTLGGDYNEGLLAKAVLGAALWPMSGYGKSPILNGKFSGDLKMLVACFRDCCLFMATSHPQKTLATNISL